MPGSANGPSAAVNEWAMTGHGQEAAPQELSAVFGAFQVTVYGVAGPWIEATAIIPGSTLSALMRFAVSATVRRFCPVSFDVQFEYVTMLFTSAFGASRRGGTLFPLPSSHRWPKSLQRKLMGGPSSDVMVVFTFVSKNGLPGSSEQSSSLVSMMIAR